MKTGLYIHIPFCRSRCAYCDFYSVGARAAEPSRFVDALLRELEGRAGEVGAPPFDTIYIGGGTPSTLPAEELGRLLRDVVPMARHDAEVTIEVNPDDVSAPLVDLLAGAGVNRVSMGVQSLSDEELRAITRRHDAAGARRAVELLRQGGISNLSLDLIYGLPGQTPRSWRASVEGILEMRPQHVSAYLLSYEPGTRLTRDLAAGRITAATEAEAEDYYLYLCSSLASSGYDHYEISNFALPGFYSRHNSSYWDPSAAYLGIGPGAHSYDGHSRRRANRASLSRYLEAPEGAADPDLCESLSADQIIDEQIMLGLRTRRGLSLLSLPDGERRGVLDRARPAIASGHLSLSADGLSLSIPERHWLIADAIISDLFV